MPLARMHPVLAVAAGNPKKIASLDDLLRPDVSLAQANPEVAAIGKVTHDALHADPATGMRSTAHHRLRSRPSPTWPTRPGRRRRCRLRVGRDACARCRRTRGGAAGAAGGRVVRRLGRGPDRLPPAGRRPALRPLPGRPRPRPAAVRSRTASRSSRATRGPSGRNSSSTPGRCCGRPSRRPIKEFEEREGVEVVTQSTTAAASSSPQMKARRAARRLLRLRQVVHGPGQRPVRRRRRTSRPTSWSSSSTRATRTASARWTTSASPGLRVGIGHEKQCAMRRADAGDAAAGPRARRR